MEESSGMSGFSVKGSRSSSSTKCGRWNPTSEQVKVLTDLFRSGLRTPSTDQIQKISSQLSFYGKIESKNVFYWFQNHKARERQKRRKVSITTTIDQHLPKNNKSFADIYHHNNHSQHEHDYNKGLEPERVIETLQLFPLNSSDSEKLRFHELCKENAFSYSFGAHGPPLDLRLSFL